MPLLVGLASTSSNVVRRGVVGEQPLAAAAGDDRADHQGQLVEQARARSGDRTSDGLPAVPIVPPSCSRRSATKSATEPVISVLFDQSSTESSVLDATYFGVLLIQLANGSSVDVGQ